MLRRFIVITALFLAACSQSGPPHTRVAEIGLNDGMRSFRMTNRDVVMTVTMPDVWEATLVRTGDDLISRNSPRGAFGIAVYVPTIPEGQTPTDAPWRRGALEAIEDSLKSKAPAEYEWVGSTMGELAGSPSLQTTVRQTDGTLVRDTYFFVNQYLLTATAVSDDGMLDAVWPDIESALATMTFDGKESE